MAASALEIGFELDRRYRITSLSPNTWDGSDMDQSKKPELLLLCALLKNTRYALIGGLALQVHQEEPRTTLDIDFAVESYGALPRDEMMAAGFVLEGLFPHSENWRGPNGTPVQFSDDSAFALAIESAEVHSLESHQIRIINREQLVLAKMRAATDSARRKSKRMQDLADVQGLLERFPELQHLLTSEQRTLFD
jgi:hypothetical protein